MQKVTKTSVNYKSVSDGFKKCKNCIMFLKNLGRCTLVRGDIYPNGVCDKWERDG